nr:helix-turn-helix domain-containing protein [Rhodococcus jostii]
MSSSLPVQGLDARESRQPDRRGCGSGEDSRRPLRPVIAASWQRSADYGIARDRLSDPCYRAFDPESRLLRVARPALDCIAEELAGTRTAILLADNNATVVSVLSGGGRELRSALDQVGVEPGMDRSEQAVGTSGIGTVLEAHQPLMIVGDEHYKESLDRFVCSGVPIFDPIGNRLVGVVNLCSSTGENNELMMLLARRVGRSIEARLRDTSTQAQRALLDEYIRMCRTPAQAVVAFGPETLMMNSQASAILGPGDHAVLWNWAEEWISRRNSMTGVVELTGGVTSRIRASRVLVDSVTSGVVLSFLPDESPQPSRLLSEPRGGKWSRVWESTLERVRAAGNTSHVVALRGESGAGKATLAAGLLDRGVGHVEFLLPANDDEQRVVLHDVRAALHGSKTVIVRRVQNLHRSQIANLASYVEAATAPIVLTGAESWGSEDAFAPLLQAVDVIIDVPPLRERTADIPQLVAEIIAASDIDCAPLRFSRDSLGALMRCSWPRNIAELCCVVNSAILNSGFNDVKLHDLPAEYRYVGPNMQLSTLQIAERDAIATALAGNGWNKSATAKHLAIGRATLYRKMREFGIEA